MPATPVQRLFALLTALICLALLIAAAWLTPDAHGHGTHTQLGLPPCGFVLAFNKPCVTCGMTTAFAHAVRLDLASAARVQPMGTLLALLTPLVFWACLHTAVFGSRLAHLLADLALRPRVLWTLFGVLLASWGYTLVAWRG
jgi:hypothetical protein